MARFLKPLVRSGGYYPSRRWTPLVYPGGYTTANGGEEPAPPPIEKTITGNPIHILDALAKPAQALSVKLEPVQDLHGYSYPWPAGGGKNKFNGTFLQGYWAYANGTWVNSPNWITTEKIPCKASTSYTVSADAKMTRWQGFVWYDSNGDFISTDNLQSNVNIGLTKTSPSNAAYLIFNIAGYPNSTDTIAPSDVTHFQLEEGSASTAYSPYANICPISGWTGANVTKTGKNLLDTKSGKSTAKSGGITAVKNADGSYNVTGTARGVVNLWLRGEWGNTTPLMKLNAGRTYYIKDVMPYNGTAGLSSVVNIGGSTTYTPSNDVFVTGIRATTPNGTTLNTVIHPYIGLVPYEEWQPFGETYSINFPSSAGTVYGGTLDVTTGKLTVTMAMVDLGTKNWYSLTAAGRTRFRTSITDIERISSPNVRAPMLCSAYKTETANNTYTGKQGISLQQNEADVYVYDAQRESMTAADFKTAMSGVQLAYKLATPQTIQLTPQQVELLLGENNIWSDGEMTLTYLADGNASDEEALNP